ncbi:MAG: family 78 glycoside hydrolase catalytic domain [Chthonomonadales bacterium]
MATIIPTDLRCEYLTSPHGIDVTHPRFSWVLQTQDPYSRSNSQKAYRIIVASSRRNVLNHRGDLWDTGKVPSADTAQITYAGAPLVSRQRVWWAVQVWDQHDEPSQWSKPAFFSMGLLSRDDWEAHWIQDPGPVPEDHETVLPPPLFRKEFTLPSRPAHATVYISALGVYNLYINGKLVGNHILPPEWTDYFTRVQYQTYDITRFLQAGPNAVAVQLGDGWYAGRLGMSDHLIGKRRGVYGRKPKLLVQIEAVGARGSDTVISSDTSWKVTTEGPIRSADLLDGEVYDARREMPGFDLPGFDASKWQQAVQADPYKGALVAQMNEPIARIATVKPVRITPVADGRYICDFGQNLVGFCRLRVVGEPGASLTLRHAEMLNDDGSLYTANLRGAPQVDRFILKAGPQICQPHFTYHGFRYVEISGLAQPPEEIRAIVFNSSAPEVSTFRCSKPMLNRLWKNILWTQRANLQSVPTDCPQRDERLGWMGDIQAFGQNAIFNMDLAAFFTKWCRDIRDSQADDGRFPDFAPHPYGKNERFTGTPGWGDAGVEIPWLCRLNYGDTRILAQQYEAATRWIAFIHKHNPDLIWRNNRGNDYNDWLNGDTLVQEGWPKHGGAVPNEVFATAFFAHSTELVARMAAELGRADDARQYRELASRIKTAFQKAFVSADGRITGDTQAGYALALYFNLLPDALRRKAAEHMVEAIHRYNDHISTGFHSTHRMMMELVRFGYTDLAYKLLNNTTFPSWGYTIENGATTIWERWDGYVKGRGFQDPGMNSFNHWALGSVGEWMVRNILGINPDEDAPGYSRFTIHPRPGGGIGWARGSYTSIRGRIAVAWHQTPHDFTLDIEVPVNTIAAVAIPAPSEERVHEGNTLASRATGVHFLRMDGGFAWFRVGSGRYHFTVRSRI